jgi:hypothetical protein
MNESDRGHTTLSRRGWLDERHRQRSDLGWILGIAFLGTLTRSARPAQGFSRMTRRRIGSVAELTAADRQSKNSKRRPTNLQPYWVQALPLRV